MNEADRLECVITELQQSFSLMDHPSRVKFFSAVLNLFGPYYRDNGQFMLDVFPAGERSGVHVLPVHYYSPIPHSDDYPSDGEIPLLVHHNFGLQIPLEEQQHFFDEYVLTIAKELLGIPFDHTALEQGGFKWNNGMFGVLDTTMYYAMARHYKPSRIVEVGSGFSTLVATRAARTNVLTTVECIEPYPTDFFSRHLVGMKEIELTVAKVQDVGLDKFSTLAANDILFIDSSHVVKSGSDVEHLIFKVLPRLSPGVIVHFHDIYLPYSYPRPNIEQHLRFWNENYLLAAYLANNAEWEILASNITLGSSENLHKLCAAIALGDSFLSKALLSVAPGGSLWIRKKAACIESS